MERFSSLIFIEDDRKCGCVTIWNYQALEEEYLADGLPGMESGKAVSTLQKTLQVEQCESASSCISYVKTAITRSESICKCHSRMRRKPVCSYLTEILSVLKFVPDSELENHLILDLRDLCNPNVCKWEYWRPWKVWWRVIIHSTCRRPRSKDKFSSVALLILMDIS